jgi:hypothetical protein
LFFPNLIAGSVRFDGALWISMWANTHWKGLTPIIVSRFIQSVGEDVFGHSGCVESSEYLVPTLC